LLTVPRYGTGKLAAGLDKPLFYILLYGFAIGRPVVSFQSAEANMLLFTTNLLPQGYVIKEMYSMLLLNKTIQISEKGLVRGLLERDRNEFNEALELLERQAPEGANAIIGIQIATATQQFADGSYLYLTIAGTPVNCEKVGSLS
jgi:regulator of nucleoside diphosphate kinase